MGGPFKIKKLSLLDDLEGTDAVVADPGYGIQCVGLVKKFSECGSTDTWRPGALVRASPDIKTGTAIATFNKNGRYANKAKGNHACFFIEFVGDLGFRVLEQHVKPSPNKIKKRVIRYQDGPPISPSDNANCFSIIL